MDIYSSKTWDIVGFSGCKSKKEYIDKRLKEAGSRILPSS